MKKLTIFLIFIALRLNIVGDIREIFLLPSTVDETSFMGAVYSLSEEVSCVFCNPAGIAQNNFKKIQVNYTSIFEDMRNGSVVVSLPNKKLNIGFGVKYFDLGKTNLVNESGEVKGEKQLSAYEASCVAGTEIFVSGLLVGGGITFRGVSTTKQYFDYLSKVGLIYILPVEQTEIHFGFNIESGYINELKKFYSSPSLGVKYYIPEYKTFVVVSYNNFLEGIDFYDISLELGFVRDVEFIVGYELTEQLNGLSNSFSVGTRLKFDNEKVNIGLGYRTLNNLGYVFSTGIEFKL